MSSINFNPVALTAGASRRLDRTSRELTNIFERLSSGQRINRAVDDAAGLAVSSALNVKSRIFNQAIRNLSDGVSLLSIADQALLNLSDIVQRQIELAQQSANGTFSIEQRAALDDEAQALAREYERIIEITSFNGLKLINGEQASITLKAGIGDNSTLDLEMLKETYSLTQSLQNLTLAGSTTAFSQVQFLKTMGSDGKETLFALSLASVHGNLVLSVSSYRVNGSGELGLVQNQITNLGYAVGAVTSATLTANIDTDTGMMVFGILGDAGGPFNLRYRSFTTGDGVMGPFSSITPGLVPNQAVTDILGNFSGLGTEQVSVTSRLDFAANLLSEEFGQESLAQSDFSLRSQNSALIALERFKENLDLLNEMRGRLGAMQSRVEVANNVLASQSEQSAAAASRIQDADISQETSELLRLTILQEGAAAVLAQASKQSELALLLLQSD